MIAHELLSDQSILIVTPEGPLKKSDFKNLAKVVDSYLEREDRLNGLMIYTESFPGWSNFAGFISHMRFVNNHHRSIVKIAAVTDSGFLSILPRIADHFLKAEIKHFNYSDKDEALSWLTM
ncbi:MAG: STAS/SEC14 domain-containing protein [Desulfobacterales bacterium]|nr:STAS/SEC14 domain-containing protein [Desulfobacterales bacterium]